MFPIKGRLDHWKAQETYL